MRATSYPIVLFAGVPELVLVVVEAVVDGGGQVLRHLHPASVLARSVKPVELHFQVKAPFSGVVLAYTGPIRSSLILIFFRLV